MQTFRGFRGLPPAMFYAIFSYLYTKIWWGYTYKTNETKYSTLPLCIGITLNKKILPVRPPTAYVIYCKEHYLCHYQAY
jgi:hypothetical protein